MENWTPANFKKGERKLKGGLRRTPRGRAHTITRLVNIKVPESKTATIPTSVFGLRNAKISLCWAIHSKSTGTGTSASSYIHIFSHLIQN